jgi:hypothetical protein
MPPSGCGIKLNGGRDQIGMVAAIKSKCLAVMPKEIALLSNLTASSPFQAFTTSKALVLNESDPDRHHDYSRYL